MRFDPISLKEVSSSFGNLMIKFYQKLFHRIKLVRGGIVRVPVM